MSFLQQSCNTVQRFPRDCQSWILRHCKGAGGKLDFDNKNDCILWILLNKNYILLKRALNMNNKNWLCAWKWGSTSKTNLLNSSMIILHPPFWKIVSGKENRRALHCRYCLPNAVVVRHNENVMGHFAYREIGWAPMLKAKCKNFQNKMWYTNRGCAFSLGKNVANRRNKICWCKYMEDRS